MKIGGLHRTWLKDELCKDISPSSHPRNAAKLVNIMQRRADNSRYINTFRATDGLNVALS